MAVHYTEVTAETPKGAPVTLMVGNQKGKGSGRAIDASAKETVM